MDNNKIVHSLFVEHFGEDNVDFDGDSTILVYFPKVRVTNEHEKSILVTKLFVKVRIGLEGNLIGTFTMNRAEYPKDQFIANYMHSHVNGIPARYGGTSTEFKIPCLGEGPIRNTCTTLNTGFDEDIWKLFCVELDMYVKTESIEGVPYNRLESVGAEGEWVSALTNLSYRPVCGYGNERMLNKFIEHVIKSGLLKFNYINSSYGVAMSKLDYITTISNEFIKWYNGQCNSFRETHPYIIYMDEAKVVNGGIMLKYENPYRNSLNLDQYIGLPICSFKGETVLLEITDIEKEDEEDNSTLLLKQRVYSYILTKILEIVNFGYGYENTVDNKSNKSTLFTKFGENFMYL